MPSKIEISYKTIVFTVFFVLGLWFLFIIRDILLYLFVSFILMSALKPAVERMEKMRIPRPLSILLIYIILLFTLFYLVSVIIPPLISESVLLLKSITPDGKIPAIYQEILNYIKHLNLDNFNKISPFGNNLLDAVKTALSVFGGIISGLSLLVLTFYLLLERKHLENFLENQLGERKGKKWINTIILIEFRLGAWVRGQLFLCFLIGAMSFVGLTILGVKYALPLAIIAGFLEIVPIIGPIVSGIPAVLAALLVSPSLALMVIILYLIIQQAENHLVVPNIMNKVVGIRPVVSIIALLIGAKIMGITGALLSIPVVLVIQTIISALTEDK